MFKKYGLPAVIALAFGAVYYYFAIPAINIKSADFWSFIIALVVVYIVAMLAIKGVIHISALLKKDFKLEVENIKKTKNL